MSNSNPSFHAGDGDKGVNLDGKDGPPPSYDAEAGKGAPPTYKSIMDQIKEAQSTSSNPALFAGKSTNIVCKSAAVTISMLVSLALPIAMIVMASVYGSACPAERMIPIYLNVAGSVSISKLLCDLIGRASRQHYVGRGDCTEEEYDKQKCTIFWNWYSRILGLFLFAWFIAGNVWVYRLYAPSNDPLSSNYCAAPLYYFAFWQITATYIFIAVCLCCVSTCCLIACCACCKMGANMAEAKQDGGYGSAGP
ncbi:transmembrane protein 272-like [Patiria miniata]|uniref:Transmembrane protein 272-like n=1 Tax=Patiria miniata TaxID=46514 RepID=A0A913ZVD6_PATMI|nr:transmembrane protein 272-like [Patiria miniata]XP_038055454.1 transmembrane protein 272-like [Patiria miniata]